MFSTFSKKLQFESKNTFIKNSELTFFDFKEKYLKISNGLRKYKLQNKSLVLVDIQNPEVFIAVVFAILNRGMIPCLWNSYFSKEQEDMIFEKNYYAAYVSDQKVFPNTLEVKLRDILAEPQADLNHVTPQSELVFFTSGTVFPKACLLTLENLFYNAQGSLEKIPFHSDDSWGLCLPHFHVGGFSIFIRALLSEASVNFINLETSSDVTHLSLVTTQLQRIFEKNIMFPNLKHCLIGGSAISEKLIEQTYQKYPLHLSYGMTEMGSQVATTDVLIAPKMPYHILKYRRLEIIDECVAVGGECLFQGYLENQTPVHTFQNQLFRTQDYAKLENGNLILQGRKDRIFQCGGENMSCDFIEHIVSNIPGVSKVRIEPEDNEEYGKIPVAYIQLSGITEEDLTEALLVLPGLMRPKKFYPHTPKSWKSQ